MKHNKKILSFCIGAQLGSSNNNVNFNIYYLIDDQSILERKDYHMMKPAPYCVKFPTFQLSKDKIKRLGKV